MMIQYSFHEELLSDWEALILSDPTFASVMCSSLPRRSDLFSNLD